MTLQKGTIELNSSTLNTKANSSRPTLYKGDFLGAALCNRSGDAIQRYRSLQGNHRDAEHHRNLRLYRSSLHERGE